MGQIEKGQTGMGQTEIGQTEMAQTEMGKLSQEIKIKILEFEPGIRLVVDERI